MPYTYTLIMLQGTKVLLNVLLGFALYDIMTIWGHIFHQEQTYTLPQRCNASYHIVFKVFCWSQLKYLELGWKKPFQICYITIFFGLLDKVWLYVPKFWWWLSLHAIYSASARSKAGNMLYITKLASIIILSSHSRTKLYFARKRVRCFVSSEATNSSSIVWTQWCLDTNELR